MTTDGKLRMGEKLPFYAYFAERIRYPDGEAKEWVEKRLNELGLK